MRHVLTKEDMAKGKQALREGNHARKLRRQAELCLLDKLLTEAVMPEWYPGR